MSARVKQLAEREAMLRQRCEAQRASIAHEVASIEGRFARIDRMVSTYAEAAPDTVCALFGSTDHLELAVNGGSAAAMLGMTRGARVTVTRD